MSNVEGNRQLAADTLSESIRATPGQSSLVLGQIVSLSYPADHVDLGLFYISMIAPGRTDLNSYGGVSGDPSNKPYLGGDSDRNTVSKTVCGSFMSLLLRQAHPQLNRQDGDSIIEDLTGMLSPDAKAWHDGIESQSVTGAYSFRNILLVDDIHRGDILAAEYPPESSVTGHVATVVSIRPSGPDDPVGPPLLQTRQYIVNVIDSSDSLHGNDSRQVTDTSGIGRGDMRLYAHLSTGRIVAWCWSTTTTEVRHQADQHMVAGRLVGLPRRSL